MEPVFGKVVYIVLSISVLGLGKKSPFFLMLLGALTLNIGQRKKATSSILVIKKIDEFSFLST